MNGRRDISSDDKQDKGRFVPSESLETKICPLCHAQAAELVTSIAHEDVKFLYSSAYSIEINGYSGAVELLRCRSCDLRFFRPAIGGDPSLYEELQRFPWYYEESKAEYLIAARFIEVGSAVLEIGCGSGGFALHLPAGCTYFGIEYNKEAIRRAQERGLSAAHVSLEEYAQSHAADFDVVCAFQVLEHVPAPGVFLEYAVQLLKPGGTLALAVPSEDSFMSREVNNPLNLPPHHLTRWSDAALQSIARAVNVNFVHLEHEPLSDLHVRAYAIATIFSWLGIMRRRRLPIVSRRVAAPWARILVRALSVPAGWVVRQRSARPRGHSVIAIFRKP